MRKQKNYIYDNINGIPIISIFKRKDNLDKTDGNPLIYALKNKKGWTFKNPKQDIISLLKQFIRITEKIKPEYDTIITIPSSNELNIHFLHRLNKIIRAKNKITDYFTKLNADEVWEDYIDWKGMANELNLDTNVKLTEAQRDMLKYFKRMEIENDNLFSFRFIAKTKYRKFIRKTMEGQVEDEQIKYAPIINGKNILILDDTISSGSSISEACREIIETFEPISVTVITLFSRT